MDSVIYQLLSAQITITGTINTKITNFCQTHMEGNRIIQNNTILKSATLQLSLSIIPSPQSTIIHT